jgi:hypothetical protein
MVWASQPQKLPRVAVPAKQRLRTGDDQGVASIEELGQQNQANSDDPTNTLQFHAALDVQAQLSSKEDILGFDRFPRSHAQPQSREYVSDQRQ